MLTQAVAFLLNVAFGTVVFAALLRFYLQAVRAPYRNPLSEFVVALTDFAVKPLRRVVPGLHGLDLASLLVAWGLEAVLMLLLYALSGRSLLGGPQVLPVALFLSLVHLLRYAMYILIGAIIVQAVLSWINPYSPIAPVLEALSRPILGPLRRRIPPVGNVDLTPLIALVICQLILMLPVAWLETVAQKLVY